MKGRGTADRLRDVLSAAEDALTFATPLDPAAFATLPETDRRTYRALKNALVEIGEAVKLLPLDLLARHPSVDWRGWAGLRDVVSHQYFNLEMALLRPTVIDELPILVAVVKTELITQNVGGSKVVCLQHLLLSDDLFYYDTIMYYTIRSKGGYVSGTE